MFASRVLDITVGALTRIRWSGK